MTDGRDGLTDRLSLVVVTDPRCGEGRDLMEVVRAALAGGAPSVQLRAKEESAREATELARRLLLETRGAGALLFVNDRVDVALAAGADGAHLGDDDLPLTAARRIVPPGFLIGRSVDSPAGAEAAVAEGADYLGVGPVFGTPTKQDAGPAVGLRRIREVVAVCRGIPVVAIGGIDADSAEAAAEAGAEGVAVIRAVMQAPDPRAATVALLAGVRRGRGRR